MGIYDNFKGIGSAVTRLSVLLPVSLLLGASAPSLSLGHPTVITAVIAAILFVLLFFAGLFTWRGRRRLAGADSDLLLQQSRQAQRLAVVETVIGQDALVMAVWDEPGGLPQYLRNTLTMSETIPSRAGPFMMFDTWLDGPSAEKLTAHLTQLWKRGATFSETVTTSTGERLNAQGLHTSHNAILVLRAVPVAERALPSSDVAAKQLLADLPHPAWIQDVSGAIVWRNSASAAAPPFPSGADGLANIGPEQRAAALEAWRAGKPWHQRIVLEGGSRKRGYDISLLPMGTSVAALAFDISDFETVRGEMSALLSAQQNAFKHLRTGIAVFGADQRLRYANPAWRELWDINEAFIADSPEDEAILDHLRAQRLLPDERDFNGWKKRYLTRSREGAVDETWYLPQGRVLRVASLPTRDGGYTIINENLSELEELRRRYATHERVQRQTFEALTDAVIVFGSDGRLQLFNPAFASMWRVDEADPLDLEKHPHIDELIAWFAVLHDDPPVWSGLKNGVIAMGEDRGVFTTSLSRRDGVVIDVSSRPLPGGATLVTFVDQTAAVRVKTVLEERNKALVDADQLKNDFIQHVSYELRSPLNSIIGFTEMLADPVLMAKARDTTQDGSGQSRQSEYIGYISSQSHTLLAIIDDILTLASIDAGAIALDITRVEPLEVMASAAGALRQRCAEAGISLSVEVNGDIGAFNADGQRVRQVLYNLLSNAIGFSTRGQSVSLTASRNQAHDIIFEVGDDGPGIAPEDQAHVFDRFSTKANGTDHRGAGLGLSIVKSFVELHGGHITLQSQIGQGTRVRCTFPERALEQHRLDQRPQ